MSALLRVGVVVLALLSGIGAGAQDLPQLLLLNTVISSQPDGFGGQMPVVEGEVFNHGVEAYRNISIFV